MTSKTNPTGQKTQSTSRNIFILGEIDFDLAKSILPDIIGCSVPIHVIMSTQGGDMSAAWTIYEALKAHKKPVDGFVYGECMSAGVFILQACRKRYATPNSRIMIHSEHATLDGDPVIMQSTIEEYATTNRMHKEVLCERSIFTIDELDRMFKERRDVYFSAQECVKNGLIDKLI